ncbi:hypothetical protein [Vibrio celticus]|uniref:hypothetical protein n=1 Tax=Vibrio celticus TaxID=446372 RepID=UPI00406779A7
MISIVDLRSHPIRDIPGVYAFYYVPSIPDYDLSELDDEIGKHNLVDIIDQKFINPFTSQEFNATISLDFEQKIQGPIKKKIKSIRDKKISTKFNDESFKAIDEFSNLSNRKAFKDIMLEVTPLFSKPVYVGVTHNIEERLNQHINSYYTALDLIKAQVDISDEDFGSRAARFAHDDELFVTIKYMDSNELNLTKESSYKLALITEWVINQQLTPVLGKR